MELGGGGEWDNRGYEIINMPHGFYSFQSVSSGWVCPHAILRVMLKLKTARSSRVLWLKCCRFAVVLIASYCNWYCFDSAISVDHHWRSPLNFSPQNILVCNLKVMTQQLHLAFVHPLTCSDVLPDQNKPTSWLVSTGVQWFKHKPRGYTHTQVLNAIKAR